MLFKDIPGLDPVKQILRQSVQRSQVAHALLFDGHNGSGALAMALAFSTYINCENRGENDSCGECPSCIKMKKLVHPDMHFIFPVAKTKMQDVATSDAFLPLWRKFIDQSPFISFSEWLDFIEAENKQAIISVDEARNVLRKLSLKSYEGEYKILIIWKPELMNISSANALLKILEEPPAKTLFLLVSDQIDKLLVTILSRTQRIRIPSFSDEEMQQYLSSHYGLNTEKARQITYLSEGDMSTARLLMQENVDGRPAFFSEWMRNCYKKDIQQLIKTADIFDGFNKESQKMLLEYSLEMFRDMMISLQDASELVRVPEEEFEFVKNFSRTVNFHSLEIMIQETNDAYFHIERNVRAKMVFLDISFAIANSFRK